MSDKREIRRLARTLAALERRIDSMQTPQLHRASIENGSIKEYDENGDLVGIIGRQEDGSHGYVAIDGPTPPTPLAPTVTGGAGGYSVRWRGDFIGGADAYADFQEVEVHAVPVAQGSDFDPDLGPDSTTRVGTITSVIGGSVVVQAPAGTYYVRLVARSRAGKVSDASQAAEVTVTTVVSGEDLADLEQRLDEAGQAIETTIPQAIENAQQAADMALLIAPVSEDAPTQADGEGRPVDAIWTRVDANGDAIGYWRWDGTNWQPLELTQAVIPNLSASKITTGTLSTDRLDANEIAARIATVIQLNADRVVSGTIDTDRLNANEIAARIANVIELNADRITGGTITADLTLQGRLQTSATGQRVVIENDAITQYSPGGQVALSTADGNVFAQGEFRSLDDSGLGVVVGAIEDLGAGSSRAGVEFPTNVPGTDTAPIFYVHRQLSGNPDLNDQALIIRGAHYTGESITNVPTITMQSHSLGQKALGNKNSVFIRAEEVGTNGDLRVQGDVLADTINGKAPVGVEYEWDSSIFSPASGVTLQGARAIRYRNMVQVHIYLTINNLTAGGQNRDLGTLHSNFRPGYYFANWTGWYSAGGGGMVSGLCQGTTGLMSIRWSSTASSTSASIVLTGSWPAAF